MYVFSESFYTAVPPNLASSRRFDLVRRTELNVTVPAIRLPARNRPMSKPRVRIPDAPVVLFLELVFETPRRRIAPKPELFDELTPILVRSQVSECLPF